VPACVHPTTTTFIIVPLSFNNFCLQSFAQGQYNRIQILSK
jgi:hypothetical protein